MNLKKFFLILIGIILCVMIVYAIFNNLNEDKTENVTEITPAEEISEDQERQTIISLYYTNIDTNTLVPEARVIDAKNLLENPYITLTQYLIDAPRNEQLKSSIPEGTKINEAVLNGDTICLNLSSEFIENQNNDTINLAIYSIVNTLTELNEVNYVKILINGEEVKEIEGIDMELNKSFSRQE